MKILMGTMNPGKIEACRKAFSKYFDNVEVEGVKVSSDVPDQPVNKEVFQGAKNRVNNLIKYAKENNIEADFYAASEAGITDLLTDEWIDVNTFAIERKDGVKSVGVSQGFMIPDRYIDEVKEKELGHLMDRLLSGKDLGKTKGGINSLTKGEVSRIDIVDQAFTMALITYINDDMWM